MTDVPQPKLAYIVTRLDVGGVPDHIQTVIGELKSQFAITVITGSIDAHNKQLLDGLGVEYIIVPTFRRLPDIRDLKLVFDLARLIRTRAFDIVHTHTSKAALVGILAALMVRPRPRIVNTAHILGTMALKKGPMHWAFRVYDRLLLGKGTDAVIVVSEAIRKEAQALNIIPDQRLFAIQNGIRTERFDVSPDCAKAVRDEFGIAPDQIMVVTVARIAPFKAIHILIQAAALLAPKHPNLRVVIVGDGQLRGEMEALAQSRGVTDVVRFAGVRRDIPKVLAAADIFALSSDCEGLPIAILEAMAAGLPIVSTAVDGIPEVVDRQVGLLCPPQNAQALADQMTTVIENPDLRHKMGEAARARVNSLFSAQRMAANTSNLYFALLAARVRPADTPKIQSS